MKTINIINGGHMPIEAYSLLDDGRACKHIWSYNDGMIGTRRSQERADLASSAWRGRNALAEFTGPKDDIPEGARYEGTTSEVIYGLGKRIPCPAILAFCPAHPLGAEAGTTTRRLVGELPHLRDCKTPESHAARTALMVAIETEAYRALYALGMLTETDPPLFTKWWRANEPEEATAIDPDAVAENESLKKEKSNV